jgi:septum site-determining protein MinC
MLQNQLSPIEIKISTVVAVSILLRNTNATELDEALRRFTGGTADYFENEFAIFDVSACDVDGSLPDWRGLISLFKSYGLNPVAVRHAPAAWEADILEQGLSLDVVGQPPAQEVPALAEPLAALVVDTPVRAGQRIYARGRDLVVTAVVNSGAELIADGSIHVYAPLRGRALAGANGNAEARIFAFSMEAELVSIAGTYRTFEDGIPAGMKQKPVQVRLAGDHIDLTPLAQFRA